MLSQIFLFEFRQRMRSPAIWVLSALLALKTISDMSGGQWQGLAGGGVPRNAPYAIYYVSIYAVFWTAIFGAGLMTAPLLRDAQTRMAPFVFSSRATSGGYFWGKYLASLAGLTLVMLGVIVGVVSLPIISHLLHLVPAAQLMRTPWAQLLQAWLIWIFPGCLVYGSIHFALASLTGRALPSYGLAVLSMAVFTLFYVAFSTPGAGHLGLQVLDPMGQKTLDAQLQFWSVPERSLRFLALTPGLIFNRALYLGVAALLLAFARIRFSLNALLSRVAVPAKSTQQKNAETQVESPAAGLRSLSTAPAPNTRFSALTTTWYLAWHDLCLTWRGTAFRIIVGAVVILGFLAARYGSTDYYSQPEQHLLPAAQTLLELVGKQMFLILIMIGVYFGSEMLARDHEARIATLVDATPVSTATLAGAKWLAITLLALALAPLPALTVFLFQAFNTYHELFPAHFLRSFLQMAPQLIVYCWLVMAIYALTRSKIASQAIGIFLLFFFAVLHSIDAIEQHFFLLGLPTDFVFSDFRVMRASNERHISFDLWYLGITGALAVLAAWLWPRGKDLSLSSRLRNRRNTVSITGLAMLLAAGCVLSVGGATAWWQLHRVHTYTSGREKINEDASYERQYASEDTLPKPRVQALRLNLNIDPVARRMAYDGVWTIINDSKQPIDHLHLEMPESSQVPQVKIAKEILPAATWDDVHNVGTWRLRSPLASGQSIELYLATVISFQGFEEKPFEGPIGDDSAWFNTALLPRFGYDRTREIASPVHRKEHGLGPRRARQTEENLLAVNDDAGWVDLDLNVTAPAIWTIAASGQKITEQTFGAQNTVRFQAKHVPLVVEIVAGQLATRSETIVSLSGRNIPMTLSYLPRHAENVTRMMGILRDSFNVWERRFGAYPLASIRLAEIPQYQTGGEPEALTPVSYSAGMIVMPERLGWLHDYRAEPARDWLTFILSEQLARSWWGGHLAAQEGPGSALVDQGVPLLLGLSMIEKKHGIKAADDYAGLLEDRLRKDMARENGQVCTPLDSNFQDYAGLQAGLALYRQRREMGPVLFDQKLTQTWKEHVAEGASATVSSSAIYSSFHH